MQARGGRGGPRRDLRPAGRQPGGRRGEPPGSRDASTDFMHGGKTLSLLCSVRFGYPGPDLARARRLTSQPASQRPRQRRAEPGQQQVWPWPRQPSTTGRSRQVSAPQGMDGFCARPEHSLPAEVFADLTRTRNRPGRTGSQASYPGTSRAESHAERGPSGTLLRNRRTPVMMSSEAARTAAMPVPPPCPEPLAIPCPAVWPPAAHGTGFPYGWAGQGAEPPAAEILPPTPARPPGNAATLTPAGQETPAPVPVSAGTLPKVPAVLLTAGSPPAVTPPRAPGTAGSAPAVAPPTAPVTAGSALDVTACAAGFDVTAAGNPAEGGWITLWTAPVPLAAAAVTAVATGPVRAPPAAAGLAGGAASCGVPGWPGPWTVWVTPWTAALPAAAGEDEDCVTWGTVAAADPAPATTAGALGAGGAAGTGAAAAAGPAGVGGAAGCGPAGWPGTAWVPPCTAWVAPWVVPWT